MCMPANPMLRKPIFHDHYHIYCGNIKKLEKLRVMINEDITDIGLNELFNVYEFFCTTDADKDKADELFGGGIVFYMGEDEDNEG